MLPSGWRFSYISWWQSPVSLNWNVREPTLLADDETNAEIAEQRVCSPETVKTHVSHILAKLGLQNRREAARWWREKITRDG